MLHVLGKEAANSWCKHLVGACLLVAAAASYLVKTNPFRGANMYVNAIKKAEEGEF
jgi:hypothetical protein